MELPMIYRSWENFRWLSYILIRGTLGNISRILRVRPNESFLRISLKCCNLNHEAQARISNHGIGEPAARHFF
jgi:hypothetical protein